MSSVDSEIATEALQTDRTAVRPIAPERNSCRFCGALLTKCIIDLGMTPLAQNFLKPDQLDQAELFYPLRVYLCDNCYLVQLNEYVSPTEIFGDYAYFSSYSDSWLRHAKCFCKQVTRRFGLNAESQVVEIASNDGYLLRYFAEQGIPVLGVEPATNVARAAIEKGIHTVNTFFDKTSAQQLLDQGVRADLLVANNVLAHVPKLNDLIKAMVMLLDDRGVISIEVPHLARLIDQNQFDTIYHEHFSYFSFTTAQRVLAAHDLVVFDVEQLPTHGGSLRVYARHLHDATKPVHPSVAELLCQEADAGCERVETYRKFADRVAATKRQLLTFLIQAKSQGKQVAGYGAPAKANTLLNYCGVRRDLIDYTVDRNPHKQGRFLPGTHIPVLNISTIAETRPDYVLILPWNLKEEVMEQLAFVRDWNAKFVVPIPELKVV